MFQAYHLANAVAAGLTPPPPLTLSMWADQYAWLSAESAAEQGRWHAYPYQPGIMDAFTDPAVETITFLKSTRVGYTKIIGHSVAYHIHYDPCPQLVVQPTVEDAAGYSKDEIAPMLRDTPVLQGLVHDPKSRDSASTVTKKIYPGGQLIMIGANSARGFRRITVRIVYFDEVDAYPPSAGQEGDQIKLGSRRTDSYWNRKIIIGGTPTIKNFSRVEHHFKLSDQRFYQVPCPTCGTGQVLRFKRLKWPTDNPHRAYFVCKACGREIEEKDKHRIISAGHWQATRPFTGHAGFSIWAAYSYSPQSTWSNIAKEFLESKSDPELLKTFVNTILGETWEDRGDGIEATDVEKKTEAYGRHLPNKVLIITAGADVQADRIELEIVAWGAGLESWSIDYQVIAGDPHMAPTWQLVDDQLLRTFTREDGVKLRISGAFIDSGYATQEVYRFCYSRQPRGVFASKGQPKPGDQLVSLSKKKYRRGLKLYNVATIGAKDKIFALLRIKDNGPGKCHFPDHYGPEYFQMLTAEKKFTKHTKGVATYYYRKIRKRNEALDCRVYALAALEKIDPQWASLARRLAKQAADQTEGKPAVEMAAKESPIKFVNHRKDRPGRRRGGFVDNW